MKIIEDWGHCGLVLDNGDFDFESSNFINTNYRLGEEMKEYFAEYREDTFIKNFSRYVDVQAQDINFTVLGTMFDYLYAKNVEDSPMTNLQNNVFSNCGEFETFVLELEAFAKKSNIREFIEGNSKYFEHATSRLNKDIQTVEVKGIIQTMENYIGSNEKVNYNK